MSKPEIWPMHRDGEELFFLPKFFGTKEGATPKEPVEPVIAGFDTETGLCYRCGRHETISIQVAILDPDPRRQKGRSLFMWVPCGADPFEEWAKKIVELAGKRRRPIYVAAHNLAFDLGQLFKRDPAGYLMLRGGIPEGFDPEAEHASRPAIFKRYPWGEVEFRSLVPQGSAPFGELIIRHGSQEEKEIGGRNAERYQRKRFGKVTQERLTVTRYGRETRVILRDTAAFVKSSLEKAAKAFEIDAKKLAHPPGLGEVDYRPHTPAAVVRRQLTAWVERKEEELAAIQAELLGRELYEDEKEMIADKREEIETGRAWLLMPAEMMRSLFEAYGRTDAKAAAELLAKLWELQKLYGAKEPAVSAPSFAASRVRELGRVHGLYTGMGGAEAIQAGIDAYRGGRIGGVYHGYAEGVSSFDFRSAYPYAMLFLPSFSPAFSGVIRTAEDTDPDPLERTRAILRLCELYPTSVVEVSGIEHNAKYPTFLMRQEITDTAGRRRSMLMPQYGRIAHQWVTGAELLAGMAGGFELTAAHAAYAWYDAEPGRSPFAQFVGQFYREKSEHKGPRREMAKLVLNALYGKLIEQRRPDNLALIFPADVGGFLAVEPERESAAGRFYWQAIARTLEAGGGLQEIEAALAEASATLEEELTAKGRAVEFVAMPELPLTDGRFGSFAIPPAAATVTGIARARLLLAMRALDAMYWATDSIFTMHDPEHAKELLAAIPEHVTSAWGTYRSLPMGVSLPVIGSALGDLEEQPGPAVGVFAGIGRYYLEPAGHKPKVAYHGLPHLDKSRVDLVRKVLTELAEGRAITYTSRPHPIKPRGTKLKGKYSAEDIGRFITEDFEARPDFDPRLLWVPAGRGFTGTYKAQGERIGIE